MRRYQSKHILLQQPYKPLRVKNILHYFCQSSLLFVDNLQVLVVSGSLSRDRCSITFISVIIFNDNYNSERGHLLESVIECTECNYQEMLAHHGSSLRAEGWQDPLLPGPRPPWWRSLCVELVAGQQECRWRRTGARGRVYICLFIKRVATCRLIF